MFCDALQDLNTYTRFSGKKVKLYGDIPTADEKAAGTTAVTRMAGTSQHDFCGTFDGQGHTLSVSLSSTYGQDYTAPFSYVSNAKANPGDAADSPAAIRNLKVTGNVVSTYKFASGLVGGCWNVVDIENCLVSTVIESRINGEGSHGGIVGRQGSGTLNIRGCTFDGSIQSAQGFETTHCAGFVGYIYGGTLTIANSLFAPDEVTVGDTESATFARGNTPTIDNCYYTQTLGEAQGKAACSAPAAPVGDATHAKYTVSGITPYANGLQRTLDDQTTAFYYGGGDNVSVSFVKADGGNGSHEATVLDATADLSSYSAPANFAERWFVVADAGVSLGTFEIYGTTHIILCDGADVTFTNTGSDWTIYHGGTLNIYGQDGGTGQLTAANGDYHDAIHCHELGGIDSPIPGNLNIYGGQVTATCVSTGKGISVAGTATLGWTRTANSIYANSYEGTIKIADGQSLYNGSEILSGTVSDSDFGTKLNGKTLTPAVVLADAADNTTAIATAATACTGGQTLAVQLAGRTLWKDGVWNTLCLPFDIADTDISTSILADADIMTLANNDASTGFDAQTGTLNLYFVDADHIEAGVPYIVKWGTKDSHPDTDIENPVFTGVTVATDTPADHATTSTDGYVTFLGTYSPAALPVGDKSNLYLGVNKEGKSALYWPSATNYSKFSGLDGATSDNYYIGACRAYFQLSDGQQAREFVLNFGDEEATGIMATDYTDYTDKAAAAWYDMQGRKLDGKPTAKGLYIHGGKKIVIK